MCEFEKYLKELKSKLVDTQERLQRYIEENPKDNGIKEATKILELSKENDYKSFSILSIYGKGYKKLYCISFSFELPTLVEELIDAYISYANLNAYIRRKL